MALTKIITDGITDDAVTSGKIPANAVGTSEIANDAVTSTQIADNTIVAGDIADATITLAKLEHGTGSNDGKFLRANNGADPTFETIDLTALSASNLTSGTVPDARISASSVTQHASSFDDNNIINDISGLALKVNALENATRYNTNSTFVDTFQDSNGIAALSGMQRDTLDEYISSIARSYAADQYYSTTDLDANRIFNVGADSIDANGLVDGVTGSLGGGNNQSFYIASPVNYAKGLGYELGADADFGVGFKFTGFKFYNFEVYGRLRYFQLQIANSGGSSGSFSVENTIHDSSTNASFVAASAQQAANSNSYNGLLLSTPYTVPTNTAAFRIMFNGNYNNGNNNSGMAEIQIKGQRLVTSLNNATGNFESNNITVSSSVSSMGGVITYIDGEGTATLNTDLKLFLSADGGSNYTEVTLVAQPDFATGVKMAKANDVTVTAGTSLKYKVVVANQVAGSKETRVSGVSMQY